MPYMIIHDGENWCVHKQQLDGSAGERIGCSATEAEAQVQMGALYANEEKAVKFAVKALNNEGLVGGYLVVWGSPEQRDLQGEYFTPQTELALNWYDRRPALYHHGLDDTLEGTAALVGEINSLKADNIGVWAQAQLDLHQRYVQAVLELVDKGVLGWSSGSLPNLVRISDTGEIKAWPIVEGSLTPAPAEPRHTAIDTIKTFYATMGLNTEKLTPIDATEQSPAKELPIPDISFITELPPDTSDDLSMEKDSMDMMALVQQVIAGLLQAKPEWQMTSEEQNALAQQIVSGMGATQSEPVPETPPELQTVMGKAANLAMSALTAHFKAIADKQAAYKTTFDNALRGAMLAQPALPAPSFTGGMTPENKNGAVMLEMRTKYADLTAKDMSFLVMLDRHNRLMAAKHTDLKPFISDETYPYFLREMSAKAEKDILAKKLMVENQALKAINFLKANELDHSTQANFGDEWVPDLWSNDLWRRARIENSILPLFRSIDMPSNPYELPVESADPTVYFVPETTAETELLISGSGAVIPDSKVGSAKVTLTAKKLALRVGFSAELVEDSIIPILSIYREQAERAIMDSIDFTILNGDTTNTATGNINSDDADPADTQRYLALNGLLYTAITEDTTRKLDAGGTSPTLSLIRAMRFKMLAAYALRPADIAYLVGGEVYAKLLGLDEFLTMEKIGTQATVRTGMIGSIDGSPVISSAEFGLAEADGKLSATPANNILGRMASVYTPNWWVGYKRRVAVSVDYLPYYDSYQLSATVRLALAHQDAKCVGVLYNLAV
jgi:capsid protein